MFSIVIPLYNKEDYIGRTIDSVLAQSFQEFEVIIVDDGSTDNSLDEVKKFDDERIRIILQDNSGVSAARNRGIKEAKFEHIAFLDADDEWLPGHLSEINILCSKFPTCDVYATNYKTVGSNKEEGFHVDVSAFNIDGEHGIIPDYFKTALNTIPPLWTGVVSVTKKAIISVGGFPEGVTTGEDLLTWARLACHYQIAYSKKITAIYHFMAPDEWLITARKQDMHDVVGMELATLEDTYKKNTLYLKQYIALWHRMRLNNFMKMGDRYQAMKELWIILKYNNKDYKSYVLFLLTLLPLPLRRYMLSKRAKSMSKER